FVARELVDQRADHLGVGHAGAAEAVGEIMAVGLEPSVRLRVDVRREPHRIGAGRRGLARARCLALARTGHPCSQILLRAHARSPSASSSAATLAYAPRSVIGEASAWAYISRRGIDVART